MSQTHAKLLTAAQNYLGASKDAFLAQDYRVSAELSASSLGIVDDEVERLDATLLEAARAAIERPS